MTKKNSKLVKEADGLETLINTLIAGVYGVGGAALGAGGGLLLRSRYEDKFKTNREKTTKDKLISKAPLIGFFAGAGLGGAAGWRRSLKIQEKIREEMGNAEHYYRKYSGLAWDLTNLKKYQSTLGLSGNEKTKSEVRKKFHELSKKYHPDLNPGDKSSENKMKEISEAWDKLQESDWFNKLAALKKNFELMDHQNRFVERLVENDGVMMAAHATGSGKTLSAIAGFETLKKNKKAQRAIVVVPASLRDNFVDNLKRYTNSSFTLYGPSGEKKSKSIGDKSSADYNIISYELFRDHGDKLISDTGADTIIMDEIHKARGTEGVTYNKLRDLRPKFKNAITLTGSVVNNEPNEVVPLLDVTHTPTGHKLVSKTFFDKLFVKKDAVTQGIFTPKVYINKSLKNKPQLANYLRGKIDYISHEDLEKDMPKRDLHTVEVPMSDEQLKIYNYSLNSVDPITRWKIRNNLPVSQKDAKDAFSQLMQARQVSTDHGIMDERLKEKNPYDYSPKVKKVVDDALDHLKESEGNKTVIYGNLIKGQVESVEKALKMKGIPYAKFLGLGQEGMTSKTRPQEIKDFQDGKKRVLLLSGAGAEGLDLKNTTMLQMLEGHYNPERIQQAESRVRRIGSFAHLPKENRKVKILRYVSVPKPSGLLQKIYSSVGYGGDTGVDHWIYTIAKRKDDLNKEFRDALEKNHLKKASFDTPYDESATLDSDLTDPDSLRAYAFFSAVGGYPAAVIKGRNKKEVERIAKQKLLDRGREDLTQKKHIDKVMAESKIDERGIDASVGVNLVGTGLGILHAVSPQTRKILKPLTTATKYLVVKPGSFLLGKGFGINIKPKTINRASEIMTSAMMGLASPIGAELLKGRVIRSALNSRDQDFDRGIQNYTKKLKSKYDRKYKSSKSFVQEYETKKDLGIDDYT